MFYSQTTWPMRMLGLLLCPIAGGVISLVRHLPAGSHPFEFACGYGFGFVACLLVGAWLHLSAGHDVLGRRAGGG